MRVNLAIAKAAPSEAFASRVFRANDRRGFLSHLSSRKLVSENLNDFFQPPRLGVKLFYAGQTLPKAHSARGTTYRRFNVVLAALI
jgi:hypothetical protein